MKLKLGSEAHRAHMSRIMKESWAKRRNRIKSREALKSFTELTNKIYPSGKGGKISRFQEPEDYHKPAVKRALNYCPNCGEHLSQYNH